MSRAKSSLLVPIFVTICSFASSHVGLPPSLPDGTGSGPVAVSASATNCNVHGTSWCAYACTHTLRGFKNGEGVSLTINSTSTNTPHSGHTNTCWNVDLTTLNLRSGDVITWVYEVSANEGEYEGQVVSSTMYTQVVQ